MEPPARQADAKSAMTLNKNVQALRDSRPARRSSTLKFVMSGAAPAKDRSRDPSPEKKEIQAKWQADYLKDLRTNRPARPTGARPPPPASRSTAPILPLAANPFPRPASTLARPTEAQRSNTLDIGELPERSANTLSHRKDEMTVTGGTRGRAHVQPPPESPANRVASKSPASVPAGVDIPYYERGQRWMEKQEACSLRMALERMDIEEERKVFSAAQDEASKLVLEHKYPDAQLQKDEDKFKPYQYREHLKKGSHARSQSNGPLGVLDVIVGAPVPTQRSASDGSNSTRSHRTVSASSRESNGSTGKKSDLQGESQKSLRKSSFGSLSFRARAPKIFNRKISNPKSRRQGDQDGVFTNPDDKIYEEPEEASANAGIKTEQDLARNGPLRPKTRNTSGTSKAMEAPDKIAVAHPGINKVISTVEIHKNPPSQSRKPFYMRNDPPKQPAAPPNTVNNTEANTPVKSPETKDGLEIRSEEIRAVTSFKRSDRSPKLPTPTVVSDRPGRPIVSFAQDYQPRDESKKQSSHRVLPPSHVSTPTVPKIHVDEPSAPLITVGDIPTISVNGPPSIQIDSIPAISVDDGSSIPSISISPDSTTSGSRPNRPLPQPTKKPYGLTHPGQAPSLARPAPPPSTTSHWTLTGRSGGSALCATCALPIAGKIVSAAGQRFHPPCFSCFQCGELLECVAFYPEPDNVRSERVGRIHARENGLPVPAPSSQPPGNPAGAPTEESDGDASLRFYCHLDFHELFSPRCRSCKTPIEGEVVLACGGEWHVGHFFCAECGDPFDSKTPFVERDGYAWCVRCHANRFSGRCAGCRKPVTEMVVKALGREWHDGCFVCTECGSTFADGRFFTRGVEELPVCVACEERRLKA